MRGRKEIESRKMGAKCMTSKVTSFGIKLQHKGFANEHAAN